MEATDKQYSKVPNFCTKFCEIRPLKNEIFKRNLPACGAQFWSRATMQLSAYARISFVSVCAVSTNPMRNGQMRV